MMRQTFIDDEANIGTFEDAQIWAPIVEFIVHFI